MFHKKNLDLRNISLLLKSHIEDPWWKRDTFVWSWNIFDNKLQNFNENFQLFVEALFDTYKLLLHTWSNGSEMLLHKRFFS